MLDKHQLEKYTAALGKRDEADKRQALQSLRQHDEQEWADAPAEPSRSLVDALREQLVNGTKQPAIQKEAASILGNMGARAKAALPQLTELLSDGVADPVREAAVTALGKMGKLAVGAVDQILELITKARPGLSAHAIRALGNIGCADERVRSVLVNLWLSPMPLQSGKAQVAIALCKLHISAENLLGSLTKTLMAHQDASFRKAAAEALAWCNKNETDVVPSLLRASLSDSNEEVRHVAQAGLDHMHLSQQKAVQLCARQLGESTYAEAALRKSGPLAVPALIEALESKVPAIRMMAARTLGSLGEEAVAAAPALTAAVRDKDLDVRLEAVKGLWYITKAADAVVPALVELLEEKKTATVDAGETRRRFLQTVMEALRRIEPPAKAAVKALNVMAKDQNRLIRESALITLQKINGSAAS